MGSRGVAFGMRMLVIAGLTNLLLPLAVGFLSAKGMPAPADTPFGMQWTITLAGMLGLIAVVLGAAAVVRRARGERTVGLELALGAVTAAVPAVILHVIFQLNRLSRAPHEAWFSKLVGISAGVRLGFLVAAIAVIADALRRISPQARAQQARARRAHPALLGRGRLLRVRHT